MSDENYWTYKSSFPTPSFEGLPAGCFKGTQKQFESLSPGMRREILRDFQRREKKRYGDMVMQARDQQEHEVRREQKQHAAEINAKARKQL
jgi:hypothetical protein